MDPGLRRDDGLFRRSLELALSIQCFSSPDAMVAPAGPILAGNAEPAIAGVSARCPFHRCNQTFRTHVGPILFDIVETSLTRAGSECTDPALWHCRKLRPQGMLAFGIYQNKENAGFFFVVFKRIRHEQFPQRKYIIDV
jgi:hypothetical protein